MPEALLAVHETRTPPPAQPNPALPPPVAYLPFYLGWGTYTLPILARSRFTSGLTLRWYSETEACTLFYSGKDDIYAQNVDAFTALFVPTSRARTRESAGAGGWWREWRGEGGRDIILLLRKLANDELRSNKS